MFIYQIEASSTLNTLNPRRTDHPKLKLRISLLTRSLHMQKER